MIENGFLSADSLNAFAVAYNESFPELKFDVQESMDFISAKFPTEDASDSRLIAVLKSENGEVASGYGVLRRSYSSPTRPLKVGIVCDVFTSIRYRKQGLFKKVSLLAIEREESAKVDFLIGYPIRDEVMPGHLSVGWRYLFNMNIWWAIPKIGITTKVKKMGSARELSFVNSSSRIKLIADDIFLGNRFLPFKSKYFVSSVNEGRDFIIFRKAKLKKMPFTCIVYLQAGNAISAKKLISDARKFAFLHGTLGVLGCWNASFAESLFVKNAGLRKSNLYQKVIVRDLNGYVSPDDEKDFELSWLDSDTL